MLCALLVTGSIARAQATSSASVSVSITVTPQATITFPDGFDFVIRVRDRDRCYVPRGYHWNSRKTYRSPWDRDCWFGHQDWWWPQILPVRIPFKVEGNAGASISVKPGAFLRIRGGRYLGRAVGWHGRALGYDIAVQFPTPAPDYSWMHDWDDWDYWDDWGHFGGWGALPWWSRFAHLPGQNGASTPPLSADLADDGKAYGVIYLVARRDWTADGSWADPGNYYGSLDVILTTDE